jgi:hypothetical protein
MNLRLGWRRWLPNAPGLRLLVVIATLGVIYAGAVGVATFFRSTGSAAAPTEAVVYAVGNLGGPGSDAPAVARMLNQHQFSALLALGNLAPPDGTATAYLRSYRPVFGSFDDRIRPTPGEIDHPENATAGYDAYFSAHAPGYKGSPYYQFSVAGWRIFSLDSKQPATPDSPMFIWLRDNLAQSGNSCIAAYWHDGGATDSQPVSAAGQMGYLWDLLAAYHADILLSADQNLYRRYATRDGITAYMVGTGGLAGSGSSSPAVVTSGGATTAAVDGALELDLRAGSANFSFRDTDDRSLDSGRVDCHERLPAPAGRPATPFALKADPGPAGIKLSWRAGSGGNPGIGFLVLRGERRIAFTTGTSYVDKTLPPGASVLYTIRAIDRAGTVSEESAAAHSGGSHPGFTDYAWTTGENPSSPTADKPQSKLWMTDGLWWGILWATDPANPRRAAYFVQRFDPASQSWTNTGVQVDDRDRSHADVLWDPKTSNLYVASTIDNGSAKLFRLSYAKGAWHQDEGFPIRLSGTGSESISIAKDSTGTLWATMTQATDGSGPCSDALGCQVRVLHSLGVDWRWTDPTVLGAPEATVKPDDISTITAFGGQIGVAWSNQRLGGFFFARRTDRTTDTAWTIESVSIKPRGADDHLSLKADSAGRVYLLAKTSLNDPANASPQDPLMVLWVREANGRWRSTTVWTVQDDTTRPQVLVDEAAARVYAIAAAPGTGGAIYVKSAAITDLFFKPGLGSVLMAVGVVNNPTSTKQAVSLADGILVLAGDTASHTYWHAWVTSKSLIGQ